MFHTRMIGAFDRHEQISRLFLAVTDMSSKERAEFLREACRVDLSMRDEIEAMIAANGSVNDFLESPLIRLDTCALALPKPCWAEHVPERIGDYKVNSVLGQGGWSVVYRATQKTPARDVAIKVLRSHLSTLELGRRIEQEARILAHLQHPGIAQVFECGWADLGSGQVPYFVMELVQGKLLTAYASDLAIPQKIELFISVCDAVEYAHQKGIIHRDLKPANILVTKSGPPNAPLQPKVLDFGIARATDVDLQITTLRGDINQLVGTLPYMSPEQTTYGASLLDTRSDVYSLGVVFFEFLTGHLPLDLHGMSLLEALRLIREQQPRRASNFDRRLKGDVETILAMAMAKDPAHRYGSAAALSSDLRRVLQNEPIAAHPPTAVYTLSKFAKRNKTLVAVITLAVVSLLVTSGIAFRQAIRATHASQLAGVETARAQLAEKTSSRQLDFLRDMLTRAGASKSDFRNVTVRQAVLSASIELEGALEEEPLVRAALQHSIGEILMSVWELDDADRHLIAARQTLSRFRPERDAEFFINERAIAQNAIRRNEFEAAGTILVGAIAGLEKTFGQSDIETLKAYGLDAKLREAHDPALAEEAWRSLVSKCNAILGEEHPFALDCMANLALHVRWSMQDPLQAEPLLREVLQRRRLVLGVAHSETMSTMNDLAATLLDLKRPQEAVVLLVESLALHQAAWGSAHRETLACQLNLTIAQKDLENWNEVERLASEALPLVSQDFAPDEFRVYGFSFLLGRAHLANGRYDECVGVFSRLLALDSFRLSTMQAAKALSLQGECLAKLRRYEDAERMLLEAYPTLVDLFAPGTDHLVQCIRAIKNLYEETNQPIEAARWRELLP